ncbi:hypothetical protein JCM1840_001400 [Sporobolomyces johnsonii]
MRLIRFYKDGVNFLVPTLEQVESLLAEGPLRDSWIAFFEQSIEGTPTPHGKASKMDATLVEIECKCLCEVTNVYKLEDIWNMDETSLFYA